MRNRAFVHVMGIVIVLFVLVSGCVQEGGQTGEGTSGGQDVQGKQQAEMLYKGVWMPTLGASVIPEDLLPVNLLPEGYDISVMEPIFLDLDKAEEAGINTLAFQMSYWADETGKLTMPPEVKEFMASYIDEAHSRGFKVWLNPEILHYMERGSPSELRIIPEEWLDNTNLIENFEAAIIETAEFAEEHDVEIFSPSSEMYVNLDFEEPGRERSKRLIIDIEPKIEAVYSGKICLRSEWAQDDFLPYYSCFGPSIGAPRSEEEKNNLINHIEQERAKGVEIMIGEMYEGSDWQGSQEEAKRNFEMGIEAARGRVSGIFIIDTGRIVPLFPESYEKTVKEFFSRM